MARHHPSLFHKDHPDRHGRRGRDRRGRGQVPAIPGWDYGYVREPGPGTVAWHGVLAAGRGMRAYGRWVARNPETRGLATALAALYPAGEALHVAAADPLLVGAFAPPAAAAAYASTWKAHHSRKYSATVAATAAGVPAWLATAAATGITDLRVLVGYTTASAVGWSAVTSSDVLRHRRARKAQQARWETIASAAGLEGSRLVAAEETRTGQRFRVDIRATTRTARQLARGDLDERIAAVLALPHERVRVATDPKHAGNLVITVQYADPWAVHVTHPALDPAHVLDRRPVMAAPLVLGEIPDTGAGLELTVYDKGGAWHTFIVAATGGGKTTLYNNIIEQATARTDTLVWAIDLRKGTLPYFWGPALDAAAGLGPDGTPEYAKALAILEWGAQLIKLRSARSGGRNHIPSPDDPAIRIEIDEGDTLLGVDSPIAHKAKELAGDIMRGGRSAGVGLDFAGQRGVIQYTGTKDTHANAGNKIVLRVNRAAEMNNVIPGWELAGMPDMSAYAPGAAGVALVAGPDGAWQAGRVRDLSDLDAVAALARRRGHPRAALPAAIAAQLPGYAGRSDGGAVVTVPGPRPDSDSTSGGDSGGGRQDWPVDPRDNAAVGRLTGELMAEVEERLRGMPDPPDRPVSLRDLLAARDAINRAEGNTPDANRAIPVPDHVYVPITGVLADRGDAGARRDEIVQAVGKSRSVVASWLAILRDHGLITASGAGKAARYYLPEHAPGAATGADGGTEDDDAA